jgi:hypothetical protein
MKILLQFFELRLTKLEHLCLDVKRKGFQSKT